MSKVFNKIIIQLVVICFLTLSFSGCAKYPQIKNNVNEKPISVKIPENYVDKLKSEDEFIKLSLSGLENLLIDEHGVEFSKKFLKEFYAKEIENQKNIDKNLIKEAIENALSNPKSYIKFSVYNGVSSAKLSYVSLEWDGNDGKGKAVIESVSKPPTAGKFNYLGSILIYFEVRNNFSGPDISFDITNVAYKLDCNMGGEREFRTSCISKGDIVVDDTKLISSLSSAAVKPKKTSTIAEAKRSLTSKLKDRFQIKGPLKQNNKEKKYNLDFETAKARIQRGLGSFKYDSEKSAFVLDNKFDNPGNFNGLNAFHTHVVSLFPDRNDTVVIFSGDYSYFKDTFGGGDQFGEEKYRNEMKNIFATVDTLLSR